jgi:hypothetical protein
VESPGEGGERDAQLSRRTPEIPSAGHHTEDVLPFEIAERLDGTPRHAHGTGSRRR